MSDIPDKLAVVDLGTNTFHLLIARVLPDGGFEEVLRESVYVHLAEEGIDTIGDMPFARALEAVKRFRMLLDREGVDECRATATAAMRTASNGVALQNAIKQQSGIMPEIISGDEEARLIAKGVLQAVPVGDARFLIMDIGGGSVEFILGTGNTIVFKKSYPIGVAVLKNRWKHSYPILEEEKQAMMAFIASVTKDLPGAIDSFRPEVLIGASGTFDVLAEYIPSAHLNEHCSKLDTDKVTHAFQEIYDADWETLKSIHWVPEERRKLITSAFCLIEYILQVYHFQAIYTSNYAIKEGFLAEMIEKRANIL
jgi:exopolyphosphatase/guanosine-5'-triphosphate,3'-diphosphate pyrophosphatase